MPPDDSRYLPIKSREHPFSRVEKSKIDCSGPNSYYADICTPFFEFRNRNDLPEKKQIALDNWLELRGMPTDLPFFDTCVRSG